MAINFLDRDVGMEIALATAGSPGTNRSAAATSFLFSIQTPCVGI